MPRPLDLREQIHPFAGPDIGEDLDPCYAGWADDIGHWGWWHVRCYKAVAAKIGAGLAQLCDPSILQEAAQRVPGEWRHFCPGQRPNEWMDQWDKIHSDRINEIYHGRRKRGTANGEGKTGVSFHKAALSMLVLEVAAERFAKKGQDPVDVYRHAHLCPAIYRLDRFGETDWKKLTKKWSIIKKAAGQDRLEAISLLASAKEDLSRPVTFLTASALSRALAVEGVVVDVQRVRPLGKPSKSRTPNHFEHLVCNDA